MAVTVDDLMKVVVFQAVDGGRALIGVGLQHHLQELLAVVTPFIDQLRGKVDLASLVHFENFLIVRAREGRLSAQANKRKPKDVNS